MAGRHGVARHRGIALRLPQGQRLEQPLHHAALAPQHQGVAGDFFTTGAALAVVVQIDAGAGAVVFANGMDGAGQHKAALVLGQCRGLNLRQPTRAPAAELVVQVGQWVAVNHGLGQGRGLDQMEPVVVGAGKGHVGGGVHVERGRNVDHAQLAHPARVVQRQAVRHPATAVVAADREARHAQRVHQLNQVLCQGALAVIAVVGQAGWLAGVAVAPQVGHYQVKVLGQSRRNALPHHMGLREAVQQQQRGATVWRAAWHAGVQGRAGQGDVAAFEAVEPSCGSGWVGGRGWHGAYCAVSVD